MKSRLLFQKLLLALLLGALLFPACGFKKTASSITAQIMRDGLPSVEEEEDLDYARQTSLSSLKMLEGMQRNNPKDKNILFMLTRSFASYTFGFVENDILEAKGTSEIQEKLATERAKRFYGRGKKFGLMLLSQNKSFEKGLTSSPAEFEKALQSFGKKDVPALFWTAFNWGSWINYSKDSPEAIIEVSKVQALMKRVMELDENYNYAGPHLFLGVFYASLPPMLGGKPEEAKKEFETVLDKTKSNYLIAKVLYAQFYAVQIQDRGEFIRLLKEVVDADAAALPEQRLVNEIAKARAEILLKKEKLYF